jgi:hypothetical protein
MTSCWSARHHGGRRLGIVLLILGLVRTPLPQPDYHNIRHHDSPGEVCEHHDHLLRWHPGAGRADDVAILHWHWFFPATDPFDLRPAGNGPAVHAHVVDWQAATWEDGPNLSAAPPARGTLTLQPAPGPTSVTLPALATTTLVATSCRPARSFSATFAPAAPLACLFQRWDC